MKTEYQIEITLYSGADILITSVEIINSETLDNLRPLFEKIKEKKKERGEYNFPIYIHSFDSLYELYPNMENLIEEFIKLWPEYDSTYHSIEGVDSIKIFPKVEKTILV